MKTLILSALYFVEGLPYGFQDKLMPLLLASEGYTLSKVSMTRLLLIPWLCKPMFAPLIDRTLTKTVWVILSLWLLSLISFITAFIDAKNLVSFAITLFLLNVFSATQDISVDAIAISVLNSNELSSGNAGQVVGYKLGALFGSSVLFGLHIMYGWSGLYISLGLIYGLVALIFSYVLLTNNYIKETNGLSSTKRPQSFPLRAIFNTTGIKEVSLFVLVYKLGETGAITIFPLYLIVNGIDKNLIGLWNGSIAMIASIIGSLFGARLHTNSLPTVAKIRLLPLFVQFLVLVFWPKDNAIDSILFYLGLVSIVILQFIGGLITTLTFTIMMKCTQCSPKSMRATHYSILATFEVLGKLVFASLVGLVVDTVGISMTYFVFILLSYVTVLIVPLLRSFF